MTAVMDYSTLTVIARVASEIITGRRLRRLCASAPNDIYMEFDISSKDESACRFNSWIFSADPVMFRVHPWTGGSPESSIHTHIADVASHHLAGAGVKSVKLAEFERVLYIEFIKYDLAGNEQNFRFVAELMGKHSNLVLINNEGIILASLKAIHSYQSRVREVRAGKVYLPPPRQNRIAPRALNQVEWRQFLDSSESSVTIREHLVNTFLGMSLTWAEAVCMNAGISPDSFCSILSEEEKESLRVAFCDSLDKVLCGLPLTGEKPEEFVLRIAENFIKRAEETERNSFRNRLKRIVESRTKKLKSVSAKLRDDIKRSEDAEQIRKVADLLTANIFRITPGMTLLEVEDWETGEKVSIPLDPHKSPQRQIEAMYKQYHKLKRMRNSSEERMTAIKAEMEELELISSKLQSAASMVEIQLIAEQMIAQGVMDPGTIEKMQHGMAEDRSSRQIPKITGEMFHRYRSNDGFLILAGKSAKSNDFLLRMSHPEDLWLHTRDIPGSHVFIVARGRDIPEGTIREAAMIAVWHSKARDGSNVPVDYTRAKYVSRIPGAGLGKVKFRRERTFRTTADPERIQSMALMAGSS